MFSYKPVRDGILVVRTVRCPAVRIVVGHHRPVPVPVLGHKPVRMPDLLDRRPDNRIKIGSDEFGTLELLILENFIQFPDHLDG